jgi:hypothetical protein
VTYATGFLLTAGDVNNITVAPGTELFGIADTAGTVVVHVIHQQ